MLSAIPIATELNTPYLLHGEATEVTGSRGTRYSFRTGGDTYSDLGRRASVVLPEPGQAVDDHLRPHYAWGEHADESQGRSSASAGKVLKTIAVPLDTKDFVPYIAQIPGNSGGGALPAFIGALSVAFYMQARTMGVEKNVKVSPLRRASRRSHPTI